MIRVIVPSRTPAYCSELIRSMEVNQFDSYRHLTIVDSSEEGIAFGGHPPVHVIKTQLPFVFSRAINEGVRVDSISDILVLNDDTTILTEQWYNKLLELVESPEVTQSRIGMIGLAIAGGVGNPEQEARNLIGKHLEIAHATVCFVAVLIRRVCWTDVGEMDERYIDYGWDDDDYCRRVRNAGYQTAVTSKVTVSHGKDGLPHSSSYAAVHGWNNLAARMHANRERYLEKWGEKR